MCPHKYTHTHTHTHTYTNKHTPTHTHTHTHTHTNTYTHTDTHHTTHTHTHTHTSHAHTHTRTHTHTPHTHTYTYTHKYTHAHTPRTHTHHTHTHISSIGKTDNDESDVKTTTSVLNKLSTQEEDTKSSFKPYKLDVTPTLVRSNNSSLMTTSDHSNLLPSTSSNVLSNRIPPISSVSDIEKVRCYTDGTSDYPALLKCHPSSPPLPHLGGGKIPYLHSHSNRDHVECLQCKTMRPHSDPLPIVNRNQLPNPGLCQCPMCNQARDNLKCHYQGSSSIPPLYPPSHKNPNLTPIITCRDPNCANCSKFSHSSVQNFLHPALIHQCTHNGTYKSNSYPVPPPPSHFNPYDSYLKGTLTPKPYVCNWVSDGKHCGSTFLTSEELFQHLRTHTNAQQQNHCDKTHSVIPQSSSVPNTCNIHGCPCGASQRKSSPKQNAYGIGPSPRYSPYNRLLPNGVNTIPGHNYPPHSLFHY